MSTDRLSVAAGFCSVSDPHRHHHRRHSKDSPAGRKDACHNNPCDSRRNPPCRKHPKSCTQAPRRYLTGVAGSSLSITSSQAASTFIGEVLDDDLEARAWMQLRREGIVQDLPVTALALETHAGHVQGALADIADGEGAICAAAGVHAAEVCRAGDGKPARRRVAADQDRGRARRIVAEDLDGRGFESEAYGSETDRRRQEAARRDQQRIGEHVRHDEIGCARAMPVTVNGQWLVLLSSRFSSVELPTQVFANVPALARIRLRCGAGHSPETSMVWGPDGSSLMIVTVPGFRPWLRGRKRMTRSIESPAAQHERVGDHARRLEIGRRGGDVEDLESDRRRGC